MLSEKMTKALNQQLNLELFSSNIYLQMSAWCEQNHFPGAAQFLRVHADEEMQHMRKLFGYLTDSNVLACLGKIDAPEHHYHSLQQLFEEIFSHEQLVTKKIHELVDLAFNDKDFSTFNFLQWYVAEQHEEETLFSGILDKFKLIGTDGSALYHIDNDLALLAKATPNSDIALP